VNRKLLFLAVTALFTPVVFAQTLPTGGATATRGSGSTSSDGSTLTLTQTSQRAIFDFTTYNIGAGAAMVYNLPNATAVSVSRVGAGGGLSRIDGALTTGVNGGHVMILNPNGVLFGANAVVNVGSLTASTGHINDDAFMASDTAAIAITGATTGSITNLARPSASYPTAGITVAQTGLVALVAPSVVNSGVITATKGRIVLASAEEATRELTYSPTGQFPKYRDQR